MKKSDLKKNQERILVIVNGPTKYFTIILLKKKHIIEQLITIVFN